MSVWKPWVIVKIEYLEKKNQQNKLLEIWCTKEMNNPVCQSVELKKINIPASSQSLIGTHFIFTLVNLFLIGKFIIFY